MARHTTRRRPRDVEAPPEPRNMGLDDRMLDLYRAKLDADEATRKLEKKKKALLVALQNANRTEHTLAGAGDRPETVAKIMVRKTNTVDFKGFAALVSQKELEDAGTVTLAAAKKLLSGNDLDRITTKTESAPFLEFKAKGGKK